MTDSVLTGALGAMLILCVIFCLKLGFAAHETRQLMSRVRTMQAEQMRVQGLLFECQNYSATNPAIDPILESVGAKPVRSANSTAKPATK